jgi:hypothetical protein
MSIDDSAISVVMVSDNMLVVGGIDGMTVHSPRVIGRSPKGEMVMMEMIGKPASFSFSSDRPRWTVLDENMIALYRESVSGLTLAKAMPHVIPMGGRGN